MARSVCLIGGFHRIGPSRTADRIELLARDTAIEQACDDIAHKVVKGAAPFGQIQNAAIQRVVDAVICLGQWVLRKSGAGIGGLVDHA